MQHFSYKTEKKRLKTRDGSTRREKNTCRERFKGNVGLQLPHCKATDRATPTAATKTHIQHIQRLYRVITKYCAKRKSTSTRTLFCKEECVCERCFATKEKCGSGSARGCALRTILQNKTQGGIRKRKEWRKGKRRRARRGRKGHFWKFLFVGRPFLFFILDSQLFS